MQARFEGPTGKISAWRVGGCLSRKFHNLDASVTAKLEAVAPLRLNCYSIANALLLGGWLQARS